MPVWARRSKRLAHPLPDLNQLSVAETTSLETIHFLGGRDYLPLFSALTEHLAAKIIVHHKGKSPSYSRFSYEEFTSDRNQNWHYDAAVALIQSQQQA